MTPFSVVTWRWGQTFGPEYVNRLRSMLARHLHIPHRLYCVTDDGEGLDPRVRYVPMPTEHAHTPRCRRRMWQFSRDRVNEFGPRFLHIDLDTVITADITAIVTRTEPLVCWRANYADVFSPAFMLQNTGYLDALWQNFRDDPDGYPASTGVQNASDLAMLNHYIKHEIQSIGQQVAFWDERHGFVAYFGKGYEREQHLGIGLTSKVLPRGTKVIVLGGADKYVLDQGLTPWARACWN